MKKTPYEDRRYLIARCIAAQERRLPQALKTINALRPIGYLVSIVNNIELMNPLNITQDCVNTVLTSRCAAECTECSRAVRHYEQRKDIFPETVIKTLEYFFGCVYSVNVVRIIGGEPFLYDDLGDVLRFLVGSFKVKGFVEVVTHGGVLPQGENLELLRHSRIHVVIDPCGEDTSQLEEVLRREDVIFEVRSCENGCGVPTLLDGFLCRCEEEAHVAASGKLEANDGMLDLFCGTMTLNAMKRKILQIYAQQKSEACKACNKSEAVTDNEDN